MEPALGREYHVLEAVLLALLNHPRAFRFDGEDDLVKKFAADVDGVVARIFDQANSA